MIDKVYATLAVVAVLLLSFCNTIYAQSSFEYTPGQGVQWNSEDNLVEFRILGYIQSTANINFTTVEKGQASEFDIRRARIDLDFDYRDTYQVFFEFDGSGSRTAMVLAQLDIKYLDQHYLRVGKFITPFSAENLRSSRSLTTVERYTALNSMFLLPALDTQYGIMLTGRFSKTAYYLSVTNGNGKASQNIKENNHAKDLQGRISYSFSDAWTGGAAINYSIENAQHLLLLDHHFNAYSSLTVSGRRLGELVDLSYNSGRWLARGEIFRYSFLDELSSTNQAEGFWGGYAEAGYFVSGNEQHGFQLTARYERAGYINSTPEIAGPENVQSFVLGYNWYRHGIFRLQSNIIYEVTNKRNGMKQAPQAVEKDDLLIISMLQIKF